MVIDPIFWKGRKVFMTGHTGFKGSWLSLWLYQLGAEITGYALEPTLDQSIFIDAQVGAVLKKNIYGDIRDKEHLVKSMEDSAPEIVIHMAAQPLVRDSYIDPALTYSTNVMGTVNMLEAVRRTNTVQAVLNITTDKCYENKEWDWGYRENEPMGGYDPYSSSKACAELVSSAYRRSFLQEGGIALATARAGNVVGGGDWAKDRIVPDAMRAFINNKILHIRNPMATRPWQHVLEPLAGYLMLCQQLVSNPEEYVEGWNFGPNEDDVQPVSTLVDIMANSWGGDSAWDLDENSHPHEASYLKLDCSKAKNRLKWKPLWGLECTLAETVSWYKAWAAQDNMHDFTLQQIEAYQYECLAK